jgi:multiple sugar transport system permease protein
MTTQKIIPKNASRFTFSKPTQDFTKKSLSYLFLAFGAVFMLFPVFWMVTSALKPEWQIFIRPPMWIPQHWEKTEAGDTVRLLNLWETGSIKTGDSQVVLEIAARRYSPVIPVELLANAELAPRDEMSVSSQVELENYVLSVREWDGTDVVALPGVRGADDLFLVVPFDDLKELEVLALEQFNSGERNRFELSGEVTVDSRIVELNDGTIQEYIRIDPQVQMVSVIDVEAAVGVILVAESDISDDETLPLDITMAEQVVLNTEDTGSRYLVLEQSDWRPTMQYDDILAHAIVAKYGDLVLEDEPFRFENEVVLPVGTFGDVEIAMIQYPELPEADDSVLILERNLVENMLTMTPGASLLSPFVEVFEDSETGQAISVRYKDFDHSTVNEESIDVDQVGHKVVILGERLDMALVLPAAAVTDAYDIKGKTLSRKTHISFQWPNFVDALNREVGNSNFITFFINSTIVAVLGIVGHMLSCTIVAYGFARMRGPGKEILFGLVLATMMLPEEVTLIPTFIIFRDLDILDTLTPMFLRDWFGNALLIFLLRQFFSTIPMELDEAARIDGANQRQVFFRIMLPLVTPALATVGIFTFLWRWNDLFHAKIFLNTPSNYTVAVGLSQFVTAYEAEYNLLMAAATVVMLPTVLLFFFAQRFFIEGIAMTGLKG